MATREELISGYRLLIGEARRIAAALQPEQWARAVDQDGWKGTEVLAHVAGVGPVVVPMVSALLSAPPGASSPLNVAAIDAMNAGMVRARADKTPAELAEEVAQGYGAVIDWVRKATDEQLETRVSAGGYRDVPLSDILMRMTVLHGVAHIYSVYSTVFMN